MFRVFFSSNFSNLITKALILSSMSYFILALNSTIRSVRIFSRTRELVEEFFLFKGKSGLPKVRNIKCGIRNMSTEWNIP